MEKAGVTRQVSAGKTNESEPLMKCRKRMNVIETGLQSLAQDKLGGHLFTVQAMTGMKGGVSPSAGSCAERGNLSPRCKGKSPSGRPMRRKVPMRGEGADRPVVVMKPSNVGGARGPACSAKDIGQPEKGGAGG